MFPDDLGNHLLDAGNIEGFAQMTASASGEKTAGLLGHDVAGEENNAGA